MNLSMVLSLRWLVCIYETECYLLHGKMQKKLFKYYYFQSFCDYSTDNSLEPT